jgi:hypothetical protein
MQLHHLRQAPPGAQAAPGNGAASQAMPVPGPARAGFAAPGMAAQLCAMASMLAGLWVASRCGSYVLKFFDIPALYEHLDEVAATWKPVVPGRVGMRWSETICSAAWRVLVAAEPYRKHAHDSFVSPS